MTIRIEGKNCMAVLVAGSKDEGHQGCDTPGIGFICISELSPHPTLFDPKLAPKGACRQRKRENTPLVAKCQSGAKKCKQEPRVNRVTNEGVRPACHELMSFLDRDGAAPVLAEMQARPNCKQQAAGGQE